MTNKKGKLIAVASLFCVMILGIVGLIWFGLTDKEVDKTQVVKVTASDETALRELLLEDANMEIEVTESMMIEEGFVVNGTKKLTGDATIQMYIGAPFEQSILTVSSEATLTMDGLVLDGNHLADGITVDEGASLTYLSGKMEYTETFGIIANGDVVIKDILMEHAQEGTVRVSKGATVSMEGGSFVDTWYGGVFIEEGGNMTISGDTVMDGSIVAAMIYNKGNLKITGGKFCNSGAYAVRNYNQLEIAYEGDDENGYIEFTSNSRAAVRTEAEGVSNISDIYVHDTRSNAVVTVGGETTITDSRIETTKDHGVEAQQGHVVVKNVTVSDTLAGAGVYAGPSANVEIENCDIARTASNGIAANSGTITAKGLTITGVTRYGVAVGNSQTAEPSKVTVTETRITDAGKFGVYVYGTSEATVVDTTISGFTKEETTGIFIASKASCTLEGDSVVEGAKQRGVKTLGTFVMNGGTIQKNMSPLHGAGMYVGPAATFTMNGGEIKDNSNMTRNAGGMFVDGGKVTIDGGKICNNSTMLSGGGIYAYEGATVYLKSGEIDGNIAGTSGDGIYFKGENTTVTVGKEFYMGNNDVRVATTEVMLDVESDSLTKHSASKPLLVTPGDTFEQGTKVVRCKSVAAATKLNDVVKSGDGSFKLNKNDKYYEIEYTKADMDMTGADTVSVSNFAEFKAAVTGTTSKRYVVLKADIAMESAVRVPGGTTVCIKDDGNVRKLTRAEGMTDRFLTTLYGTGLYLQGTADGNLILDGTYSKDAGEKGCDTLVYVAGSTVVKGVVLQNNGLAAETSRTRGALLNQWYGDISIYNSVFTGGNAYTAGALVVSNASGYIENSTFMDNKSFAGGGAIRMEKSAKLEIVSSTFAGNIAGSTGGAIVSTSAKKLTVTDTTFDNNLAQIGGAVRVMGKDNYAFFNGSEGSQTALFTNNSATYDEKGVGGAIAADGTVQVLVSGYNFTKNTATGYGGAIYAKSAASTVILTNSTFYENIVGNSGAAVAAEGSTIDIISCEIGKENAGNVAASKGGALIVYGKGTIRMSLGSGFEYKTLAYNSAKIGGAVCVYKGTFIADGYTIANNGAQDGAGMYVYAAGTAETSNTIFKENVADKTSKKNYGGAVCVYGTLKSNDDTYEANTARVGGAVFVGEDATAEFGGTTGLFKGNVSTDGNGNAICAFNKSALTVDGYAFEDNHTKGSAVVVYPGEKAEIKNSVFTGNTKIYGRAEAKVAFSNLTGANLTLGANTAVFIASDGVTEEKQLLITPKEYTPGTVLLQRAEGLSDEAWITVYSNVKVSGNNDGMKWRIDEEGKLQTDGMPVASITNEEGIQYYYTLAEALAVANAEGSTGPEASPVVITIESDAVLTETYTIKKNVVIQNKANEVITLSRGHVGDLFVANAGVTFQLGATSQEDAGQLIVDGAWIVEGENTAVAKRSIYIKGADTIFVLQKNATLQNANSSASGAAIVNFGTCHLYGNMLNNISSASNEDAYAAGAILQCRGSSSLTIYSGTYTGNMNTGAYGGGGVIGTQVTSSAGTAGQITIAGGTFSNNSAAYGGVIYVYTTQDVAITGGTFSLNTAGTYGGVVCTAKIAANISITGGSFSNNSAGTGGVVYLYENGTLTINGVKDDGAYGVSFNQNEATRYGGGAIFVANKASITVSGAIMTGNCAAAGSKYYGGGAIVLTGNATATISNCTISGNTHAGTLADATKNTDGCDITFRGNGNKLTEQLILQDDTSFNGIVGHVAPDQKATLQVVFSDGTIKTLDYGTRYNVDCETKTLTEIQ